MAKNYVQAGTTLAITATAAVKSGCLVQAGDVFVVAVTDIAAGATGDGIAHGVFLVPKLATDVMAAGKKVYLKDGKGAAGCHRRTAAGGRDLGAGGKRGGICAGTAQWLIPLTA